MAAVIDDPEITEIRRRLQTINLTTNQVQQVINIIRDVRMQQRGGMELPPRDPNVPLVPNPVPDEDSPRAPSILPYQPAPSSPMDVHTPQAPSTPETPSENPKGGRTSRRHRNRRTRKGGRKH